VVLAAIPAVAFMFALSWILMRFVAAREPLGAWTFTVVNDQGKVIGHGGFSLVAKAWTTAWSPTPPFVTFAPTLACADGIVDLVGDPMEPTRPLPLDDGDFAAPCDLWFSPKHMGRCGFDLRILLDPALMSGRNAPAFPSDLPHHQAVARYVVHLD
jgi:hypothetical protein